MAAPTPAVRELQRRGVPHRLHQYEHDRAATSYGQEAADAMGVDAARICKTLVAVVDGRLAVAVVPVTGEVDLKALAAALGGKRAAMADPSVAERATGYVVGGISPIGQKQRLATVVDSSVDGLPTVYVSGGRRGLEIELAPADLVAATGGTFAAIGARR